MAKIRWTPEASSDFEAAVDYIAHDSPGIAGLFAVRIIETIDKLQDFPQLGRVIPERNDPIYRELIQGNYRIFYRYVQDTVEILALHPCAKLFDLPELN